MTNQQNERLLQALESIAASLERMESIDTRIAQLTQQVEVISACGAHGSPIHKELKKIAANVWK